MVRPGRTRHAEWRRKDFLPWARQAYRNRAPPRRDDPASGRSGPLSFMRPILRCGHAQKENRTPKTGRRPMTRKVLGLLALLCAMLFTAQAYAQEIARLSA